MTWFGWICLALLILYYWRMFSSPVKPVSYVIPGIVTLVLGGCVYWSAMYNPTSLVMGGRR